MEVLIYIAFALVTFPLVWMNGKDENIGLADRFIISFGFAGVWPIVWMLLIISGVVMGMLTIMRIKPWRINHVTIL